MPQWEGHPPYTITTYRSPRGTLVDDDLSLLTDEGNADNFRFASDLLVTGMHIGSHIDALCHAIVDGEWYGGYRADKELGDFGARRCDAATIPPIIVRGTLFDVAGHRRVQHLRPGSAVTAAELAAIADQYGLNPQRGASLVRTGAMTCWPEAEAYNQAGSAGIDISAAQWLAEDHGAVLIGADTPAVEQQPSSVTTNPHPVHTYLMREHGIHQLENLWLEELARRRVYHFALICLPLKISGATASMVRPVAVT